MDSSGLVFLMLAAIVAVAVVAIPYPIAFVVAGSAFAFVPQIQVPELDPKWVFLIFLPPLLMSAGYTTDWLQFKQNGRAIGTLAIGLVIFTTGIVAVAAHALLPDIGWAACFVLGAVISPPDAVAAGSVFERFAVPGSIVTILEGEGLVNDAVALVLYGFAIEAVTTGHFSLPAAGLAFVVESIGGVAFGLAAAWASRRLIIALKRFDLSDTLIEVTIQLILPFAIYVVGETIHVSSVLAVVSAGIYLGRGANRMLDADARLVGSSVWQLLVFLLNGFVFLLIGLQMRSIVTAPSFGVREIWIGLGMSLLVIVVRLVWCYPALYIPAFLENRYGKRERPASLRNGFVIAWSGMRGIVSLASALSIPLLTANGASFPGRDVIIFITFVVIFVTLVFQGLTLIPILKWLDVIEDGGDKREVEVRIAALRAGIARLRELEPDFVSTVEWEVEGRIVGEYEYRIGHLQGHLDDDVESPGVGVDHLLQAEALKAERREIARLRAAGEIPDEIFRTVQYDLDLADQRLD